MFYRLLPRLSITQTTAVTYLLPICGAVLGTLAGEEVGAVSVLGVLAAR